jgi:cellulose synthase/poly-beta-1,6-N-acetylglucosamine synthase-like glycosyltransferase
MVGAYRTVMIQAEARTGSSPIPVTASRAREGLHPIGRRILEVLPPVVVWAALTSPVWGAIFFPHALGIFLVAFAAYWWWRSLEFTTGLLLGLWRLHRARRQDWLAAGSALRGFERLHHLVIVPTYKENEDILSETLGCLARQTLPRERITVVLAFEARDGEAPSRATYLTQHFAGGFGEWLTTFHPDLPGEVKGKSSNVAWAARRVEAELIDTRRLDPRNLIVTVCDADSRLDPQYLAALGQHVLSHRDGRLHMYQPAILFYANFARLPLLLRAVSSVFSLYSLARLAASHRLVPQSTYSLSWLAARRVDFWDVDVVPEDSHMFFKVWLHFGRRVRTRAIHLPVYADAAEGATARSTIGSTYQQIRRWAWGVSDIPYVALRAMRARHIPWHVRVARLGWYVEEHLVWPAHWFLLTLGGVVPPLLNPQYAATAQAVWQSSLISTLLTLCLPSLVLAIIADALLKRRSGDGSGLLDALVEILGFVLLPLTGLAMVALPALDAHTRLLLGRSLAYEVTEKQPARGPLKQLAPTS